MEINPKIISNYKYPSPLFSASNKKILRKLIIGEPPQDTFQLFTIAVHPYHERQSNYRVPCVAGNYDCPHCFLGTPTILKTYAISSNYKHIYECHDITLKPVRTKAIVCLLSFTNNHKCAFALNSFVPLGMYPCGIIPYADILIDDMYSIARELK